MRLSDDEGEMIERLAEKDGRSVSNYTRRVIQQHLSDAANREKATR